MRNPFLIGTQVYLRPLERPDAPLLVTWFNDPEVRQNLRRHLPLTLHEEEAFIDRIGKGDHDVTLGIALRATNELLGVMGLHQIDFKNRHACLGISLGVKEEWGKGHGTEATSLIVGYAFETLNLNRVWLEVYEDNARGLRCYEKVGFRREGVLRQANFRAGRYWDTIVMAILREEWEALQQTRR